MSKEALGQRRYFKVQRLCFTAIGINIFSEGGIKKYYLIPALVSLFLQTLCMAHYAAVNINDVSKVTDALNLFWQSVLAVFKLIIFMYKQKAIVRLVKRLWFLKLKASLAELEIIAAENQKDVMFSSFYLISVAATGVMCCIAPLILAAVIYVHGGDMHLTLPARGTYYIDTRQLQNYLSIWLWTVFNGYTVCFGSVALDSLFSWFSHNTISQFRVLKLNIQRVATREEDNVSTESIIRCIQQHRQTIAIAEELNHVYGALIFVKFTISCAQICCLAFQFSKGGALADLAFQGLFLISVAMQMFLYCHSGQRIRNESESIGLEFYMAFNWHAFDAKRRRLLLLPIMRSQRVFNLTGFLFTVNLSLFLWVFRTAISLTTLLWAVEEKKVARI